MIALPPVRMAIVGANFGAGIARNLATAKNAHVQVAAICDLDKSKAERLASELGVAAFDNLDSMLGDSSIEAVGLFTSPCGRANLISKILDAERHVMTTKPFELDLAASAKVFAQAKERKLALHLNSPAPVFAQDMAHIKRWIAEYDLGQPIGMRAETWCRYSEEADGRWYDDPNLCPAAPIFRLGVYFLNDFAALLGDPKRVHVMQSRVNTRRPTPDNAQLSIEYANGALANIFASFCTADGQPYRDHVTLNFERGTIYRWVERIPVACMADDHAVVELRRPGTSPLRATTQPGSFAGWYDWQAFQSAIRGNSNVPLQNAEAVLFGLRLVDAMRRSALTGLPEVVS